MKLNIINLFKKITEIKVIQHIGTTFIVSIILQLLNVVTGIITARTLGPTGKGILTTIILWPGMLASIGNLGITEAISFFGSQKPYLNKRLFATTILIGIFQIFILITIGLLLIPLILRNYSPDIQHIGELYLIFIPLNIIALYMQYLLGSKLNFKDYNIIRFTVTLSIVIGIVGLAIIHKISIENIIFIYLVSNLITLLLALTFILRQNLFGMQVDLKLIKPLMSFGIKAQLSNVTLFVNERLDQLLISLFLPAEQLGLYAVSVTMTTVIILVGTSLAMVALPTISKKSINGEVNQTIANFVQLAFWLSVAISLSMIMATPQLINLFFGSAYLKAVTVERILCVAAIPLSTNRVLQASLKAINKPLLAGISELIAASVTIICLIILLPIIGILGAAIASLIAYSCSWFFMMWFARKNLNMSFVELLLPNRSTIKLIIREIKPQYM